MGFCNIFLNGMAVNVVKVNAVYRFAAEQWNSVVKPMQQQII